MKRIYIAGPYTSTEGQEGEDKNIRIAAEAAARFLKKGWAVFCPHTMTSIIDREFNRDPKMLEWEDWLATDISWISVCDAICMLPKWRESKGAVVEHMVATALGLEIIYYG